MKIETLFFDKLKSIIPERSKKNIFFFSVSNTSYEAFFYSYIDDIPVQCYKLTEQGKLDERELDIVFEDVVKTFKDLKHYHKDKKNIITVIISKAGITLDIEYYDKTSRIYEIKKDWKEKYNI